MSSPSDIKMLAGGCYCGRVGYQVDDAFDYALICHCGNCRRTTGSAFKPFVYSALIEQGAHAGTLVSDRPIQMGDWSPQNYDDEYLESISLRQALARSKNMPTIRLVQEMGPERTRAWAALRYCRLTFRTTKARRSCLKRRPHRSLMLAFRWYQIRPRNCRA